MNRVPEPVTVKQRVHLDVHAARARPPWCDPARPDVVLVGRPARPCELWCFPREQVPEERLYEIVVDAIDTRRMAMVAEVLGGRLEVEGDEEPGRDPGCTVRVPGVRAGA